MKKLNLCNGLCSFVLMSLFSLAFTVASYDSLYEALQSWIQCDTNNQCIYITPNTTKNWWYTSGSSISWFKFYCNGWIYIKPTKTDYSVVHWYLNFDTAVLTSRVFNVSDYLLNWDLTNTDTDLPWMWWSTYWAKATIGRFDFIPNTQSDVIWIDVCDKNRNCTPYSPTTSTLWDLTFLYPGSQQNRLSSVKWAIYDLYAWPCTPDTNKPTISSTIDNKVYTWVQTLTWLIYDISTSTWNYWFNWHTYSETWVNYVQYDNTQSKKMDNQQWIDSRTINVSISCSDCGWSQATQSLTTTKSANAWTTDRNVKTWDNHDRWYLVSFATPDLKLERPTTVTMTGCDLPNETWAIHCTSQQFTFNKTTKPTITGMYNTNGVEWRTDNVFPSRTNEYMITVSDNPAWISVWSVRISFDAAADLSGNTTPAYVLSGSDLNITESWTVTDYGVRTIYEVRFNPLYDLLEWTQTKMTVYVEDYVWNTGSKVFNLNTRWACSSFGGCRDYLNIKHFSELDVTKLFSGLTIVVTWTDMNSIYPYLTWDTLFCGSPWTGATLTPEWKMNLYTRGDAHKKDSLTITGSIQNMYKAENSDDLDYDTNKTSDSRSLVDRIDVK